MRNNCSVRIYKIEIPRRAFSQIKFSANRVADKNRIRDIAESIDNEFHFFGRRDKKTVNNN